MEFVFLIETRMKKINGEMEHSEWIKFSIEFF